MNTLKTLLISAALVLGLLATTTQDAHAQQGDVAADITSQLSLSVLAQPQYWVLNATGANNEQNMQLEVIGNVLWNITQEADLGAKTGLTNYLQQNDGTVYTNGLVLGQPVQLERLGTGAPVNVAASGTPANLPGGTGGATASTQFFIDLSQVTSLADQSLANVAGNDYRLSIIFTIIAL